KSSQRLNFSFGLRWELNPAPTASRGVQPYTLQGAGPDTWTLAPEGTRLWQTTWYNFAPRLGVVYAMRNTPGHETVIRGGAGLFFDTGQQLAVGSFNGPGFTAESFPPTQFPGDPAALIPPSVNPPVGPFAVIEFPAPHLQLPYTLEWSASVGQALGKSQSLNISYVGSHAARLLRFNQFQSSVNPLSGYFERAENGLTSGYDSLQLQF